MSMEEYRRYFGTPDAFIQQSYAINRLYIHLPDFDVYTTQLYSFLLTVRNGEAENEGTPQYHRVWMSHKKMQLLSGITRKPFERSIKTLEKHGLVTSYPSQKVPKGKEYVVHDPLTYDEFAQKYPEVIEEVVAKMDELEKENEVDRKRRDGRRKKRQETERKLEEAAQKPGEKAAQPDDMRNNSENEIDIDEIIQYL